MVDQGAINGDETKALDLALCEEHPIKRIACRWQISEIFNRMPMIDIEQLEPKGTQIFRQYGYRARKRQFPRAAFDGQFPKRRGADELVVGSRQDGCLDIWSKARKVPLHQTNDDVAVEQQSHFLYCAFIFS